MVGTTSAHAENTKITVTYYLPKRNYLRVRGEYLRAPEYMGIRVELPPRARRIPYQSQYSGVSFGTTSACAENTNPALTGDDHAWNYLRVRGEYNLEGP